MLSKIRNKLTVLYTCIFGGFLLAFVLIITVGNMWSLYRERVNEVEVLAARIAREQQEVILKYNIHPEQPPTQLAEEADYDISGQVFYYVLDHNGRLIKSDQPVPILREEIMATVLEWQGRDTKLFTLDLPNGTAAVIITAHKVYQGEQLLGTVYVGKDVTAYFHTLKNGAITILLVAVCFICIAALLGYVLAGRVLIPVEESLKRQKQFVADASHELRTPLSVLQTSVEAIELDEDNTLSDFSSYILADVKDELQRIKRLISSLLTLARADAGEGPLNKQQVLINDIAEQVEKSLRLAAEQKYICLSLCMPEDLELNGDRQRLEQLLYILVENGIKYTPEYGRVTLRTERAENSGIMGVRILVDDTGPGIKPEDREHIFERFYRADKARSRNEGFGLGLSIAKWIVDAHHGSIEVQNNPKGGSRFIVFFPN
ncbi:MAG: integral rane sensor signal transduction histidine kinase [Firmicutes bacterium]|nr:integral rane sensor signal transduction histidine kinase [Bacillota bacterium]